MVHCEVEHRDPQEPEVRLWQADIIERDAIKRTVTVRIINTRKTFPDILPSRIHKRSKLSAAV
jgi:hypothetical protein